MAKFNTDIVLLLLFSIYYVCIHDPPIPIQYINLLNTPKCALLINMHTNLLLFCFFLNSFIVGGCHEQNFVNKHWKMHTNKKSGLSVNTHLSLLIVWRMVLMHKYTVHVSFIWVIGRNWKTERAKFNWTYLQWNEGSENFRDKFLGFVVNG